MTLHRDNMSKSIKKPEGWLCAAVLVCSVQAGCSGNSEPADPANGAAVGSTVSGGGGSGVTAAGVTGSGVMGTAVTGTDTGNAKGFQPGLNVARNLITLLSR